MNSIRDSGGNKLHSRTPRKVAKRRTVIVSTLLSVLLLQLDVWLLEEHGQGGMWETYMQERKVADCVSNVQHGTYHRVHQAFNCRVISDS